MVGLLQLVSVVVALLLLLLLGGDGGMVSAQQIVPLPSLRDQAQILQRWVPSTTMYPAPPHLPLSLPLPLSLSLCRLTNERVNEVLPRLMEQYGVELWLLSMREYGEDPVFWGVKSATQFAARRRTIIIFHLDSLTPSITRHDLVDNTDQIWVDLDALLLVCTPPPSSLLLLPPLLSHPPPPPPPPSPPEIRPRHDCPQYR